MNIFGRLQMGKPTIRLTIFWYISEGIRMYLMFDHSGQQIVIVTIIWWWRKLGTDYQWINKDHRDLIWRDSISRS
jgi:hypothetical protein